MLTLYRSIICRAAVLFLASAACVAAATSFPTTSWDRYETPEQAGFSSVKLAAVREASEKLDTAAMMIVHRGRVVDAWGDLERKFQCHSLRKSFLSALYGIQVHEGKIDLDASMADLGIDDRDPLSETEKQATVRMLLQARSGVYHPALYETAGMAARRPARHSHAPGTFWYYNNWDFNALGTIYEQETGEKIHASFEERIARPIGMEDFTAADGRYVTGQASRHAAYPFTMSARDLARFGLLFLNDGEWNGRRVLPAGWVAESVASYSDSGDNGGYGYMWWVADGGRHFAGVAGLPEGIYTGRGAGGHVLAVVPSHDLVVVHRVNTFDRSNRVPYPEFGSLLVQIVEAMDAPSLALSPGAGVFDYEGDIAHPRGTMRVFYHAPEVIGPETRIWFIIHGAGRNADGYRDAWIRHLEGEDVLMLAPEFTAEDFPEGRGYNLGNARDRDGRFRPEEEWAFSVVERLFDHVREGLGLAAENYVIYGHSAGSQFVHRMLLLRSGTRARAAFLANAGWYTMPRFDIDFPFGLGGTPARDERLREVFGLPVVVLLGDRDTDENHHQLSRSAGAMAQGPHRFARGQRFFETARETAAEMNAPFAWSLEVVEGVAHSNAGMARAAARLMREHGSSVAAAGGGN